MCFAGALSLGSHGDDIGSLVVVEEKMAPQVTAERGMKEWMT
jgi:hypothetical protein